MPLRSDWSSTACPIAHSADALSDPWVLMILRELFTARTTFDEIKSATGIADSVLARRLRSMQDADLIVKTGSGYRLTEDGERTLPILHAYAQVSRLTRPDESWGLTIRCAQCGSVPPSADWCPTCAHPLTTSTTLWSRRSLGDVPFHLVTGAPA